MVPSQCFHGPFWLSAHSSAAPIPSPSPSSYPKPKYCDSKLVHVSVQPLRPSTATSQIYGWEPDPISGHREGCDPLLAQPSLYEWSTRTTHSSSEHHQSEVGHCFHHFVSFTKMTVLSIPQRAGHLPVLTLPSVLQTPIHALTKRQNLWVSHVLAGLGHG